MISRTAASMRTKKAWTTRRRSRVSGNAWKSPHGKVKLKGFAPSEIEAIRPAFELTDAHLKSSVKLPRTTIKKTHPVFIHPTKKNIGAVTSHNPVTGRSTIKVSSKALQPKSTWYAPGLVAHEIGHLIGPYQSTQSTARDYNRVFGYRGMSANKKAKSNPLRSARNYQARNAHEDFAETYRSALGLPMTKRHTKRFDVYSSAQRTQHMRKHYFK